jgi:hypothetical protein
MATRLLLLAVMAASLAASALAAPPPALKVMRERPLVVKGANFRANESVRVTVRTGERRLVKRTQAGPRGGFTVEFRRKVDFCSSALRILAQGSRTGTVRAKLPVRACPSKVIDKEPDPPQK